MDFAPPSSPVSIAEIAAEQSVLYARSEPSGWRTRVFAAPIRVARGSAEAASRRASSCAANQGLGFLRKSVEIHLTLTSEFGSCPMGPGKSKGNIWWFGDQHNSGILLAFTTMVEPLKFRGRERRRQSSKVQIKQQRWLWLRVRV